LSAIFVGAALGYVLDDFFMTKPWCMIVFLFFGGAAGVLNVYRLSKREENSN
jgi:ATP synthase protein I